jgi:hypothetical protein
MRYFENLPEYTTTNDIAGFKAPYQLCGIFENQVLMERYFTLTNYSKNPLWKRCNEIAYGGLGIRNEF